MPLTKDESYCIVDVLKTLAYNDVTDLKIKLKKAKKLLNSNKYKLMIYGDQNLYPNNSIITDKDKYKIISSLEGRWSLQSQLFYHLTKTKKVTQDEYNEIINF